MHPDTQSPLDPPASPRPSSADSIELGSAVGSAAVDPERAKSSAVTTPPQPDVAVGEGAVGAGAEPAGARSQVFADASHAASVDPRELAHYQALADRWWDEKGPFWPLHVLNRLRVEWIVQRVAETFARDAAAPDALQDLRVLDIGCGGGILAEALARRGARVTAIDVTPKNIAVAENHRRKVAAEEGLNLVIDYRLESLEALAEAFERDASDGFDCVCNMEVLEHVEGPIEFLRLSAAQVRPGGLLLIATLNRTWRSWLIAIVGAEYLLKILPRGTHRWSKFLHPVELTGPLQATGFAIAARTGVRVNPWTRRMRCVPDESVNYMFAARRDDG
ncbi:MAG: bifunctional 2-polyprenyl-6-hydroxyphenol methylase/3-demethylubiquinol 3-O-methyltransferase UbiG [Thioalkalivibrionaceae bacterium]